MKDQLGDPGDAPGGHGGVMSDADAGLSAWLPLLEELPLYFWESDATQRFTFLSDGIARHLGVDPESRIGCPMMDRTTGMNSGSSNFHKHLDVLTSQNAYANFCFEKEVSPGRTTTLMTSGVPRLSPDGRFLGLRGLTFDLGKGTEIAEQQISFVSTDRARADALAEEVARKDRRVEEADGILREVLDEMSEGLLVITGEELLDPDNRILIVNKGFRTLFGLSEAEVFAGQPLSDLLANLAERGDGEIAEHVRQVEEKLLAGQPVTMRIPSQGKSHFARVAPRRSGGFVIMHTDVTEIDQQYRDLRKARDAEIRANRSKSQFLANMSHEIRTPMNGIVGVADLLLQTSLTQEQAEYVQTIQSSAEALTGLIGDILDFSKIEAGHLKLKEEDFDLRALADEMTGMFEPMARTKGLKYELYWAPDMPRFVKGDPLRLRQILINLIGNSLKFTSEGYVLTSFFAVGDAVRIQISDSGIGIPEDQIAHVFSAFHQVDEGYHRKFEGTGLGLAISKQLIDCMGGEIEVTSRPGQGTSFKLDLPLNRSNVTEAMGRTTSVETINFTEKRILLAEDNRTNQLVVSKMLKETGATLDIVEDGQNACEAFEQNSYDVILMDISMPNMDGIEATEVIRRIEFETASPPVRIVALTGNAFDGDRDKCLAAGMDAFLTKPIRLNTLLSCLSEQLNTSADASDALWSEIKEGVEEK